MKNIILTNHRSGSTYIVNTLGQISRTLDPSHVPLGEVVHPGRQPGWITLDENKRINKEWDLKTGKPLRGVEYLKQGDLHLDIMKETTSDFTAKVFIENYMALNQLKFWDLVSQENVRLIVLYRRDIEDAALSRIFMEQYKITHSINIEEKQKQDPEWTYDPVITYDRGRHYGIINHGLMTSSWLQGFRYNFVNEVNEIRSYEEVDGTDLVSDFQRYFDQDLTPIVDRVTHITKLLSKEEKKERLVGYSEFREDFEEICERYGLPHEFD